MKKITILCVLFLLSCQRTQQSVQNITIDGSSTVFPLSEAIAEEFQKTHKDIRVLVASSGTGGGFKRLCKGEVDIAGASRPIAETEKKMCAENDTSYSEFPVAHDGISIVVNPENTWAHSLTVQELKKIWEPGSKIQTWADVKSNWPKEKIKLYGPGHDSGTFDYFTKEIVGKEKSSRSDFTASEDDNVLIMGVAGDKYALGYFGFAYYQENISRLKLLAVDAGKGPVQPTRETILSGRYQPLSRPLYIYISNLASQKDFLKTFVEFYLNNAKKLSQDVGYVGLNEKSYKESLNQLLSQKK